MWHHFSVFDTLSILDPLFAYKHNTRDRWEQLVLRCLPSPLLFVIAACVCVCCVCVCYVCFRLLFILFHLSLVRSFLFSFALLQLRLFLHLVDMF